MNKRATAISTMILALSATPGLAASSTWHHGEGASLRVVTSDHLADGRLRGALEIRLNPGWKTYWLDPGDAGVPPMLSIDGGAHIEIAFPAPKRFDDGYAVWAGYDHPVSLALTFELDAGAMPSLLQVDAFLGICETICIPVQAQFTIDAAASASSIEDEAIVENAFASLPSTARSDFAARGGTIDEKSITVDVEVPDGAEIVDLFVASDGHLALGSPERVNATGFSVPILRGGDRLPASLAYTLVTSAGAVSGLLDVR